MRSPSGGRRFRPWLGAVSLGGSVAVVLWGSPLSAQAGTVNVHLGTAAAQSIVCPSVADKLTEVPTAAKAEVDRNLALLDKQIQEANDRLSRSAGQGGPNFVQNAILGPLAGKRAATIDRISIAIGRVAQRPTGLNGLDTCTLGDSAGDAATNAADVGPSADDFVDIRQVPEAEQPQAGENGSTGTFVSQCGTNSAGHSNADNVILAPGMSDGAQLQLDYVGNTSTDAFSTNETLAAADTTCRTSADRSAYFWPTLRVRGSDDESGQAGTNNVGTAVQPSTVRLEYRGNPTSDVTAAPRFLRMVSGEARAATNGAADARPTWTCTGFTDRLTDKYPICPSGSELVRVFDMPSCWDGQNLDSAGHRTHLVFPDETGACPSGTEAVPQLRMTLTYENVPNTADVPFAVDGFASEQHDPSTDHAGSIGVMSEKLMNTVVRCINSGKDC
ncbi:DUF1996 domain-containing protein [Nonomuraea sp. B19D2]|uniref:DUF1996 domain-containing protein n=1 Tax=Nonomuraea sp. B19D2 TaxID=3159561 RepID=UPI0032DB9E84